jgi:hypothetical protein
VIAPASRSLDAGRAGAGAQSIVAFFGPQFRSVHPHANTGLHINPVHR